MEKDMVFKIKLYKHLGSYLLIVFTFTFFKFIEFKLSINLNKIVPI